MDHSSKLTVSSNASSLTLHEWDTTINQFDSEQDVKVQRLDLLGSPGATVSLYSTSAPLAFTEGPSYFFHNATKLTLTDNQGKAYEASKSEAAIWVSKGSCLTLSVELSSAGEASLIAVSSGSVPWTTSGDTSTSCGTSTVLVGAGTTAGGGSSGGPGWIYNEVQYTLTEESSCSNPLTHGANGYSQTDEPIGPLDAHYHTRGTLYYNQFGTSKYNDELAPNDVMYTGELRFINQGVYYGPEEMCAHGSSDCFIASVHESDPAAVNPAGGNPTSECPFACMNTIDGTPSKCVKASTRVVV